MQRAGLDNLYSFEKISSENIYKISKYHVATPGMNSGAVILSQTLLFFKKDASAPWLFSSMGM
jgi:hypothetical protein